MEHHGTGSYPCPPQGWQRNSRLMASQPPLIAPYFCSALIAYAEQLGLYLQVGGKMRDGPICQARAIRMKSFAITSYLPVELRWGGLGYWPSVA